MEVELKAHEMDDFDGEVSCREVLGGWALALSLLLNVSGCPCGDKLVYYASDTASECFPAVSERSLRSRCSNSPELTAPALAC